MDVDVFNVIYHTKMKSSTVTDFHNVKNSMKMMEFKKLIANLYLAWLSLNIFLFGQLHLYLAR